jgi:GAF domain-containing protein
VKTSKDLRQTFDALLAKLLQETGASRTTLRLDDATHGFHSDDVVAEALAPGEQSMRGQAAIKHRPAATAQWLEQHRTLLVQDNFDSGPDAPAMLRGHYRVKAQMLAPIIRAGRLDGWISVHEAKSPRRWREADKAAIARAVEVVLSELAKYKENAVDRDSVYYERITGVLLEAAEASRRETGPERALSHITRIAGLVLGDPEAKHRPGAFRPGERDLTVTGIFFAAPARDHMVLLAEHGFPADQRHLRISIMDSNPGHVVRTGEPKIVPNTDHDPNFRKILSSARMGSAVYVPMVWQDQVLGMFNIASQARNTYDAIDLRMGLLFGNLASATWMALGGPRFLADLVASLPTWREAG